MTDFRFNSAADLLNQCHASTLPISHVALLREQQLFSRSPEDIRREVRHRFKVMKSMVETGLNQHMQSRSGLTQSPANKYYESPASGTIFRDPVLRNVLAYSIAANSCNACGGRIVASPTAGSSGILAGVLTAFEERIGDKVVDAVLTASAIGMIAYKRAFLSGARGGCQAEIGVSAAMTAAGLTEALGGLPDRCVNAAALALKNALGLTCDPVGGLVEVPCVKRNGFFAIHACVAAELSLAGINSFIPLDEVIDAMRQTGTMMSEALRETSLAGLAKTPTAMEHSQPRQDDSILPTDIPDW
ncbi:MAG TPA: L-serine ammonia-lyase, iron-sulfur-dependent, subunit alpha [Tepidisphaeraceae bacterium]|nr:L-serine ammonia-lyase, iron-sulfur-dependent, subunit alpha [Tepidisphaeraceae bacterium]